MSNTLTIEQVGDSLTRAIAELEKTGEPIDVISNGKTLAQLVPPDDIVIYDNSVTPAEVKQIAMGLALGELDIAEGRVFTMEEAVQRLRKVVEARGERL